MNRGVSVVKVVVLGASGMLGSMVLDWFKRERSFDIVGTAREATDMSAKMPSIEWRSLDAENCSLEEIQKVLDHASWAVNAIGVIKPYVHDDNPAQTERATRVNSLFPHLLAKAAKRSECRVVQIATDCVYSGTKGNYVETDPHDPLDVYGKTKSLGEVFASDFGHLRCSIIGPEPKAHVSLLDWFLNQKPDSMVNGYVNHNWNGITTLHFAKLLSGIIKTDQALPHVQHIVPADRVSKYELLLMFARYFKKDLEIKQAQATFRIDRTLATLDQRFNHRLWKAAGYSEPPSVAAMVEELANYEYLSSETGGALQQC
ncbi:MAG: sugar nucleotide-binding protein [Candidatus Bathyarchaeia archaeon]|jgi:dTDP-4-dehydrorhamnose reductase